MLVILFLNQVYDTSHLDIALCGISVTLLDSSVSFFFGDGVPMFVFATWIN